MKVVVEDANVLLDLVNGGILALGWVQDLKTAPRTLSGRN